MLVFDLGGGTFDVSVLEVGDGVFEVLSTSGDTHLDGDDFDKRIVDWLVASFKKDEGIDLLKDKQALQRLTETAEKAKMELSTLTQAKISLPFITTNYGGPKHIDRPRLMGEFNFVDLEQRAMESGEIWVIPFVFCFCLISSVVFSPCNKLGIATEHCYFMRPRLMGEFNFVDSEQRAMEFGEIWLKQVHKCWSRLEVPKIRVIISN